MRIVVAGWIGSTNLGDELVFAGLRAELDRLGVEVVALSRRPHATRAAHAGIDAVSGGPAGLIRAVAGADAMVLGGGGLLQDETSGFNLPHHLARPALARLARRPVAGVGLGAGRLDTRLGRSLVRRALAPAVAVSVRDAASADLLAGLGLPRPTVAVDLALSLPDPRVAVEDRLVVALRPWSGDRGRLPVAVRRRLDRRAAGAAAPEWFLAETARNLDETSRATGLAVRFVAFEGAGDDALHRAVAARMATPVSCAVPDLAGVVEEVARGRVVLAMRYHAGIAAVLGGRPSVLVGYSPKVSALAAELGAGAVGLAWRPGRLDGLSAAVESVTDQTEAVVEARARLRDRATGNRQVLERLLAAVAVPS